jgi:tetratricopeptide (TPR) repeat protein
MRSATVLTFALMLMPFTARAEDRDDRAACLAAATPAEARLTACSAAIDSKAVAGAGLSKIYCTRGETRLDQGDREGARTDLETAIALDSTNACAYLNRGRVFAATGQFDRAIADYDEALKHNGKLAPAYNNRGDALFHKGDFGRATADFSKAIATDPGLAIAYGNRGFMFYRLRQYDKAVADYSRQIALKPDVLAFINRGNAYRDQNDLDHALADYGKVVEIAPDDARGWRNRGSIYLFRAADESETDKDKATADYHRGLADYDKALALDANDAFSWNNRGQAKMRLGDKDGAIADLKKALELRPDLNRAAEALRRLQASE